MKKITCPDCRGSGHFLIEDTMEPCQACHANGYLIYVEEDEAYGNDCKGGVCE